MTLNRTQRIIVRIGGCILLFELLFPPWTKDPEYGSGARLNHFLFSPPKTLYTVDTMLLFVQIAAIVTGTALLAWWFHSHQASAQSPPEKTSKRGIVQRFRRMSTRLRFLLLIAMFLGLLVLLSVMYPPSNP